MKLYLCIMQKKIISSCMATKEELILIFHCYYELGTILQHPLKSLYQDKNSADAK